MTEKSKATSAKGPGDPCPGCGTELMSPRLVTVKGKDELQPEGAAYCPSCKYVLTEEKR